MIDRLATTDSAEDLVLFRLALGGIITRMDFPMTSSAVYANIFSAPRFHERIVPSRFLLTIASSDDSTMAAKCSAAICMRSSSMTSKVYNGNLSAPR